MSGYRFCRTDDIALLVDALNRCWLPHFPGEPPATAASFKRSIRDLQVWCSSCMVAFSGADPIGVLIGAKRPSATLVHRIAVHPDHLRQGHGRHLLASLSSKLSILGPPKLLAEVPDGFTAARALFASSGYTEEATLTDYDWQPGSDEVPQVPGVFVMPVSVDDLAVNGLLDGSSRPVCWERSVETLTARKDEIAGLAVASDDRIEACILYVRDQILLLRSLADDGGGLLRQLLARAAGTGPEPLRLPKVHPGEIPHETLRLAGFRPGARHGLYSATARPA